MPHMFESLCGPSRQGTFDTWMLSSLLHDAENQVKRFPFRKTAQSLEVEMAVVLYSTFTRGRGREGRHRLCGMELCQAVLGAVSISRARHPVLSLIPHGRQGPIYRCAIGGSYLNVSKCISHFI